MLLKLSVIVALPVGYLARPMVNRGVLFKEDASENEMNANEENLVARMVPMKYDVVDFIPVEYPPEPLEIDQRGLNFNFGAGIGASIGASASIGSAPQASITLPNKPFRPIATTGFRATGTMGAGVSKFRNNYVPAATSFVARPYPVSYYPSQTQADANTLAIGNAQGSAGVFQGTSYASGNSGFLGTSASNAQFGSQTPWGGSNSYASTVTQGQGSAVANADGNGNVMASSASGPGGSASASAGSSNSWGK